MPQPIYLRAKNTRLPMEQILD